MIQGQKKKADLLPLPPGFPYSFGIFQDYYREHDSFKESSDIAVIGTCALVRRISCIPLVFRRKDAFRY